MHRNEAATVVLEDEEQQAEAPLFAEVLRHCDGNQSRAAACLGINRATLRKKLKAYGLA